MHRSGTFVAEYITPTTADQVQPNGVDLTLDSVFEQRETGQITSAGTHVGDRDELTPTDGTYTLTPGAYVARYGERIQIPEGHVGFVYPRSSLMRNSCMLHTAVWDAGYEGRGEGLLEVHHEIELEDGVRFAQLVLTTADHEDAYDGSYQGENIE